MTNTEKLVKAQEKLTKKEALLKKYIVKAEKITAQIEAKGWSVSAGKYQKHDADGYMRTDEARECYFTFCDLEEAEERIEATREAIEEQKRIIEKWQKAVEAEQAKAKRIAFEYPKEFNEFRDNLVSAWTKQDLNRKAKLLKAREEMEYKEFYQKFGRTAYNIMHSTEEDFRKSNERSADALILNLWNRVKEKTGTPTAYNLYLENGNEWEGVVLNGTVKGTDGIARVESIYAGGYNIQKFHIRTLVK